ncbi:MAG: flavin reductase family protein [Nisaea sp.]|uniref:flavin reductase family protein n=1 Tax=Nisaea sp. TaxID=2024842 RepID=UPI001B2835CF|nr:flavin reductase family protein [Nisaea sp.]MBO6561048.1 flavin reductase family protein [Nisaea sp.]
MKSFNLADLSPADAYKLMRNVVTPRPIALVTTIDEEGVVNAAPFSFFNAIAFDPCMVVLGLEARPDGSPKDTSRNIRTTREFVVNMVDRAMAEQMNLCSTPLPHGESEIPLAGFTTTPSEQVAPPRIAEAPAILECTRHTTLELGNRREIVVGEVRAIAVRDDLLLNEEKLHIDHVGLDTIARLGANFYATSRDTFEMVRPDGR